MFLPKETTRKFDRNIFNGRGKFKNLYADQPVDLLFYFRGDKVVGTFEGRFTAFVYEDYRRGEWLPVQVFHNGVDYCGWVHTIKIEAVPD